MPLDATVKLFRFVSSSLGTMAGISVELATAKMTLPEPTMSATPMSCATISPPSQATTGTDPIATARTRSIATCTPRNGSRVT
jgi:hypothetical protein